MFPGSISIARNIFHSNYYLICYIFKSLFVLSSFTLYAVKFCGSCIFRDLKTDRQIYLHPSMQEDCRHTYTDRQGWTYCPISCIKTSQTLNLQSGQVSTKNPELASASPTYSNQITGKLYENFRKTFGKPYS